MKKRSYKGRKNCGAMVRRPNAGSKHLHLFEAKFMAATNYQGARVKVTSLRFKGQSITAGYNYGIGDVGAQAKKMLMRKGVPVTMMGEGKTGYILGSPVFKKIK